MQGNKSQRIVKFVRPLTPTPIPFFCRKFLLPRASFSSKKQQKKHGYKFLF